MSRISDIVTTIRTAIYGKDMREAIAQGFEIVDASDAISEVTDDFNALGLYVDENGYVCQKLSGE